MKHLRTFIFILIVTAVSLIIAAPKNYPVHLSLYGRSLDFVISSPSISLDRPISFHRDLDLKKGLDLQGGTEVVLEADMGNIAEADRPDALASAQEVISRRVNLYGVNEASVRTQVEGSSHRILVALPGVDNPEEALNLIGQTAQLDFREPPVGTDTATFLDFTPTDLSGQDLKRSTVVFDQQTGKPQVSLEFTPEGAKKFAAITERNVGNPVAIMLDGFPISAPRVEQKIEGGNAVITGDFTVDEAKNLSITLNAGALPVPIKIVRQNNIAPTLGEESIKRSLQAGMVGLGMVALFMVLLYGKLGLIADIALVIYGLITLALYKLIPVTLTLPGLAGFILSIGMAVDSNILIFERMKEELRKGSEWRPAMEAGFGKAWDSIKDANIATLITTFILFNPLEWQFLNTSGLVRGFAFTLFIGIVVSLFTGIVVTRTLLRIFYDSK